MIVYSLQTQVPVDPDEQSCISSNTQPLVSISLSKRVSSPGK